MDLDLGDYRRWLYYTAAQILPGGPFDPGLEDLVQEGQIAMWRAMESFDASLGTRATWVTNAARSRMKELVWGHGRTTGHEPVRGFQEAEAVEYIDDHDDNPGLAEAVVDIAEPVLMQVLKELPDEQREYIFLRFWMGIEVSSRLPGIRSLAAQYPVLKKKWVWQRAREVLSQHPEIRALR